MNTRRYQSIIIFVAITILATIGIQLYWNYINYKANKADLVNQVQTSLDNAIEKYYADIVKKHEIKVVTTDSVSHEPSNEFHEILKHINNESDTVITYKSDVKYQVSSSNLKTSKRKEVIRLSYTDSSFNYDSDSLEINLLASKLFFSMNDDAIGSPKLSKLLAADFKSKNWPIKFGLLTRNKDCENPIFACDTIQTFGTTNQSNQLVASAQSTFLPRHTQLEIHFSNISTILLKQSLIGISLSFLLSAAIIFCLLFLFKIIRQQKELAEIKNDLISNITHEFKTPITTVAAALEGIQNFNAIDSVEKTKRYLDISNQQLAKLNIMVEKLLETASLDSHSITLSLEEVDLADLINQQLEKYRISNNQKTFKFEFPENKVTFKIDPFHFESAIGNLIDNAVKYGGDTIQILLNDKKEKGITVNVIDNGNGILKDQRTKIFDKFYRIPTGNVHDVKGFGIGLYYAKNIVENHGGKLELISDSNSTNFKITLFHGH